LPDISDFYRKERFKSGKQNADFSRRRKLTAQKAEEGGVSEIYTPLRSKMSDEIINELKQIYKTYLFTDDGKRHIKKAVEINIAIMRAFVEIRNMLSYKNELSQQLKDLKQELEIRLGEQDTQIIEIYDVLDQLMEQKNQKTAKQERKKIGF
jgi:hypothetical protein